MLNSNFENSSQSGRQERLTSSDGNQELYVEAKRVLTNSSDRKGQGRSLCPMPDCSLKQNPKKHKNFTFADNGTYHCKRCQAKGHLSELAKKLPALGMKVSSHSRQADPIDELMRQRWLTKATVQKWGIAYDAKRGSYTYACDSGAIRLKGYTDEAPKYSWAKAGATEAIYGLESALTFDLDHIYLVEGEPDVWTLDQAGLPATSFTMGAGTIPEDGLQALADTGKEVRVIYDRDTSEFEHDNIGYRMSLEVASKLEEAGVTTKVFTLPDGLGAGSDVSILYGALEGNNEAFRGQIQSLEEVTGNPVPHSWPEHPGHIFTDKPPSLPLNKFPEAIQGMVASRAKTLRVPVDSLCALSLASLSASSAGKAVVEVGIGMGWKESLSIFTVVVAPSGEYKSVVFGPMKKPIQQWQDEKLAEAQKKHRTESVQVTIRKKALDSAIITASKTVKQIDLDKAEVADDNLRKAENQLPEFPLLLKQNATKEGLIHDCAIYQGRGAFFAPEGGPLKIIAGQFNEGMADCEVYNLGWSGEGMTETRKTREGLTVPALWLTMAVMCQPGVIERLRNKADLRAEGFFARIQWIWPKELVGWRQDLRKVDALNQDAIDRYERMLLSLLLEEPLRDEEGELLQKVHTLNEEALEALYQFMADIEPMKRPGGILYPINDWAGKFHGQVLRDAVHYCRADRVDKWLQELIENKQFSPATDEVPPAHECPVLYNPIEKEWIETAIEIGWVKQAHSAYAYEQMERNQISSDKDYLIHRIRSLPEGSTLTALNDACKGRASLDGIKDVNRVFYELVEGGNVREIPAPRTGKAGRPKSPTIELHPKLRTDIRKIREIGIEGTEWDSSDLSDVEEVDDGLPF